MFRSCVNAAIAQLVDYAKYFDDKANREAFRSRYGLDVYEPRLVVVIGRAHHFLDDVNRRELAQLLPNRASVWTYDDLVNRAKAYHELAGLPLR